MIAAPQITRIFSWLPTHCCNMNRTVLFPSFAGKTPPPTAPPDPEIDTPPNILRLFMSTQHTHNTPIAPVLVFSILPVRGIYTGYMHTTAATCGRISLSLSMRYYGPGHVEGATVIAGQKCGRCSCNASPPPAPRPTSSFSCTSMFSPSSVTLHGLFKK